MFETTTPGMLALREWLVSEGVMFGRERSRPACSGSRSTTASLLSRRRRGRALAKAHGGDLLDTTTSRGMGIASGYRVQIEI
jgi:hypothetical protein